jgi:arginine/lysine/ornithine decarboxylase
VAITGSLTVDNTAGITAAATIQLKKNTNITGTLVTSSTINTATITGGTWTAIKSAYLNQAVLTTSSPSFVLVSSIDSCIKTMAKKSVARQIAYEELLENFRDKVKSLQYVKLLNKNYFTDKDLYVYDFDITRLVFIGKDGLINGMGLYEALLHRYNFVFEMACSRYLVGISTIADNSEGFSRLYDALGAIGEIGYKNDIDFGIIDVGKNTVKKAMKPYEVMELEWEWIPIHDAENRVVKNYIKVYPPSIPILVPGEIITKEVLSGIDQLQGLNIQGLVDGKVAVIKHGG